MSKFRMLLSLLMLFFIGRANAAENSGEVYLSQQVVLQFAPEDAFFLVEFADRKVQRVKAMVVPLNAAEGKYIVGIKLDAETNTDGLAYSILILGKANQFESIPSQRFVRDAEGDALDSIDALQGQLSTRKSVLASYNLQVQSQEESLRRLRQDAEVIGNFGRVLETSDEIERMKMDISNAEKSAQSMETLMRLAASMPVPKNAIARETQLTMQVGELAQAAKSAEASEMSRKVGMETDLKSKLAVVESSRFEDYDSLQRQLDELRSQRVALEAQKGISHPSPDATPLAVSPDVEY